MPRNILIAFSIFAFSLVAQFTTLQAKDVVLTHQGRILNSSDQPISGNVSLTFRIFEVPVGGAPLWTETQPSVTVDNGLFTTLLGMSSALSSDVLTTTTVSHDRWLEVQVGTQVISPRMMLASVPNAAIATRISGDLESKLGHLGLLGADAASRMDLDDNDDSTGIVITGADSRMIVVKHRLEPHECRLAVGDINRDGFADIVTTPEASSITLMDSTGSGSASISSSVNGDLGLQPLGGEILIHGADGSSSASVSAKVDRAGGTMTGDLAVIAGPSSAALAATLIGSALNMIDDRGLLGLREFDASVGPDASRLTISSDSDGDGIASKNIGLYVSDVSGQSKIECSSDNDDDGIPDQEIVSKITPTIVQHAINTKGTGGNNGRVGITSSTSLDSAIVECSSDADGDGNPELLSNKRMINADAKLKAIFLVDVDDDGTPESEVSTECDATSAKHAINTKGTGGNNAHTKVVSRTFEGGADVDVSADGDGDGHDEATIKFTAQAEDADNAVGCDMGMSVDIDDDGDDECAAEVTTSDKFAQVRGFHVDIDGARRNSFETSCDSASAKLVLDRDTGRSKGFMRVAPEGPSISLEHEFAEVFNVSTVLDSTFLELNNASSSSKLKGQVGDLKGDITLSTSSGGKLQAQLNDQKAQLGMSSSIGSESMEMEVDNSSGPGALPSSSFRLGRPAVNEGLFVSDATSMSLTLLHDEGGVGSSSAAMFSDLIDSHLNLTDDGITSYRASSSSGMEMRSSSDVATCTIDRNGNQYLSNTLSVGVASSGHHIEVAGGAYCDGTNWVNASDKNSKENFEKVNGEEILEKISNLEITKWNYKGEDGAQHIGPTAQDFKKAFGVGKDDKSISTIDPSGIALAAIQELYAQLKQKEDEIASLRKSNAKEIEELRKEMAKLRELVKNK